MSGAHFRGDFSCPHCGAAIERDWGECWLCHQRLDEPAAQPESTPRATRVVQPEDRYLEALAVAALIIAVLIVWIGVTALAPGLGFLMLLAIIPAVIRTAIVTHRRSDLGKTTSRGQTALMFLLSLVLTGTMLCVTGFIAFWTFCLTCLGAAAVTGMDYRDDLTIPIAVSTCVTLTIVGLLVWLFSRLVRKRYRQDISK